MYVVEISEGQEIRTPYKALGDYIASALDEAEDMGLVVADSTATSYTVVGTAHDGSDESVATVQGTVAAAAVAVATVDYCGSAAVYITGGAREWRVHEGEDLEETLVNRVWWA